MTPVDLAFYTTQELIGELMRRKTFQGVVIHSDDEESEEVWGGDKVFKVHLNANLTTFQASRILESVAASIDRDE